MATVIEQEQRLLSITTPLGDDVLFLQSVSGTESLSSLFAFNLDLLSSNEGIKAAEIVGKKVTFRINLADGTERFFNGHVSQFVGGPLHTRELRRYRAEVVPWLWFLTRATNCRIFQFKSAPQIIEQIFQELDFNDFEMDLQGSHPERVYCVQYRETSFNFVSRLMEEEGMFYWFRHEDGKHTLVITDHMGAYVDCLEKEIEYFPGTLTEDHISQWEHHYAYRSGKYSQTDYNFETPSTSLLTSTDTLIDLPELSNYELYDFPGGYRVKGDGENLTKLRMEEDEVPHDVVRCVSDCRSLHPGGKFTVTRHECPSEEGKSYVVTSVQHLSNDQTQLVAGGETYYENNFECIPDAIVFRPGQVTPKPKIRGPQTAVVVGPAGEEIYPDEYGRVKVQFHWDREGQFDENSSCWVRVSSVWGGKTWGGVQIPRIGQEVIVDFIEGDIDRPIITGRVYNAEQMPPYPLPDGKVISGLKSNSTKGGGGYNEYVFDDTKGNELIREHGQFDKDSTIENDLREHVLHDRSRDVTNNETIQVGNDRAKTIGNNETSDIGVDRTETVGSNETISVGGDRTRNVSKNETVTVALTRTHSVGVNEMINVGAAQEVTVGGLQAVTVGATRTLSVGGGQSTSVGGSHAESVGKSHSISVGKDQLENVGANKALAVKKNYKVDVDGEYSKKIKQEYNLRAKKMMIEAEEELMIKVGSATLVMKKNGDVNVNGKKLTIKGSGDVIIKGSKIKEN